MHWVHVHPLVEKKIGAKFTGKVCKCTPRQKVYTLPRQINSPIFEEIGEIWAWERLFMQF